MRDELTMAELNREFYGPPPRIEAKFFDREVLDPGASKEAGRRVMRSRTYIHLVCHREQVQTERPVQEQDKKQFSEAWAKYMQEKKDAEPDAGHREVPDLQQIRGSGL
jgi:hypothetical protein